jgi:transcriptional regulator with XRE-family HTH domain
MAVSGRQQLEFSRRLRRLMATKRLSQSDLARMCWGEEETRDGFTAARGRDLINRFCAGKSLPDEDTARILAEALDVAADDLMEEAMDHEQQDNQVSITINTKRPDEVRLTVDARTTVEIAMKIVAMLEPKKPAGDETR